jgi:membrane-bound metal-dependent hydrolase YbcI (DUF457 family)
MPLPIAHSLVGASVITVSNPQSPLKDDWRLILFGAFLAIAPDFDFFFIWALGKGHHRVFSHSIFTALMLTVLMLLVTRFEHVRSVLACGAAFLSHGLLDYLCTKDGGGVGLFWPFSDERLKLGVVGIFEFPNGINLIELAKACLIEIIIFAPLLLSALLMRNYLVRASRRDVAQSPQLQ